MKIDEQALQDWWDRRPAGVAAVQIDCNDGRSRTLVADTEEEK